MRPFQRFLCLSFLALAGASPLAAQKADSAKTADARDVRAVVDRLFDGMRHGDSTAVRSVFHPEARLQSAAMRNGQPALRTDAIDGFVAAVGKPHDKVWDERISNVEIRVDGPLAMAWMDYDFYLGDMFSHCGVDTFQLFRSADGWKVIQLADTRRTECGK